MILKDWCIQFYSCRKISTGFNLTALREGTNDARRLTNNDVMQIINICKKSM